jgi:hypothetical protein
VPHCGKEMEGHPSAPPQTLTASHNMQTHNLPEPLYVCTAVASIQQYIDHLLLSPLLPRWPRECLRPRAHACPCRAAAQPIFAVHDA